MKDRRIDEKVYRLAKFCKALSNAVRLELVMLLRERDCHVTALAEKIEKSRSTTSRHLANLAANDLVRSKTSGRKNI